jgi:hypothetical protein
MRSDIHQLHIARLNSIISAEVILGYWGMQEARQPVTVSSQAVNKTALVARHYDLPVFCAGWDVVIIPKP